MPTALDHRAALIALLPPGLAWRQEELGGLASLLDAFAQEFGRLDARAVALLEETDPRTADELIDEWESVLGLPDPCTAAAATTLSARQLFAWRKLAFQAGQTRAFYIALAASIGYAIEIHEFDPAVDYYDPSLTPLIGGGSWRFVWRVNVTSNTGYRAFSAGRDCAGDNLTDSGAPELECIIRASAPAHTRVIFTYTEYF